MSQYKCWNTTEQIFQKGLILIKQINQKNVCFVIIGIFLDKNFSYALYLCNGCYYIMQKSMAIAYVKGSAYRIYFWYMNTCKAISLMTNSNSIDKKAFYKW